MFSEELNQVYVIPPIFIALAFIANIVELTVLVYIQNKLITLTISYLLLL